MLKKWYQDFSSQPHQPFFTSGFVFLILSIFILFGNYNNLFNLDVSLSVYHGYALVFLVFIQFFLGFLFVVFPRFLVQAQIKQSLYMNQFHVYLLASILFFIGIFVSYELVVLSQIILFYIQVKSFLLLLSIHKASTMKNKNDTKWVLISFFSGLLAHGLFIISMYESPFSEFLEILSLNMGFYLFLFMLILAIAQRMVPFFTSVKVQNYVIKKSKYFLEILYVLLFIKVLFISFNLENYSILIDLPLFLLTAKELYIWRLPIFKTVPIMWVLYVSLYWIPIGFFLACLQSLSNIFEMRIYFEQAVLHIFALGYFMTILLGFGTRVVLGHSNRTPTSDTVTTFLFIMMQAVVLLRLFASFSINFELNYIFYIKLTAILFIIILLVWALKYLSILLKLK